MSFKLAVAQMDCVLGDVAANLERMDSLVGAAAAQGATVAVLPELATTGYFVGDRIDTLAETIPGPTTDALGADCPSPPVLRRRRYDRTRWRPVLQ